MIATLLPLLILLPLVGFVINGAIALHRGASETGTTARHPVVRVVGPGVLIGSFVLALALFGRMRAGFVGPVIVTLGSWMPTDALSIDWSLQLDQLSMVMVLVITGIGSLIHLFSIGYMQDDPGYARYFAYLNLFVAFMLVLVLGASYPVLFVGWEGVGLASYLLIGFWFGTTANADAGRKAFVVNRVGDFGFLVAMGLMWVTTRHLDFAGVHTVLGSMAGSSIIVWIALGLFVGCAGKSAQLPLYIWLPDAMAGPTPVSALIHAATMVTAGVYLIARASPIFSGAPEVSLLVTMVGAVTALFAATIALRQWDIKKVLAYSTVSQLGYMMMAVGSGAYVAGVFHLVTHAFFKALLFLGAGSVIHALHHAYHATDRTEDAQDLRNMGGLGRFMPLTAAAMTVASLAIAGIPPLAGFFSKDEILSGLFARAQGSPLASSQLLGIPGQVVLYTVYGIGLLTALLTAIYMTRLLLLTFFGQNRTGDAEQTALHEAPWVMTLPVLLLGALTIAGGWLNLPSLLPIGRPGLLTQWLQPVVGVSSAQLSGTAHVPHATELLLVAVAIGVACLGVVVAVLTYRRPIQDKAHSPEDTSLLARAYGVDAWVHRLVVRPVAVLSQRVLDQGVEPAIDGGFSVGGSLLTRTAVLVGTRLQDGDVGKYAWLLAAGAVVVMAVISLG